MRVLDYPTEPAAMEEVQTLLSAIEALLLQVDAAADSELGRLRSSSHQALAAAHAALASRAVQVSRHQEQFAGDARLGTRARNSVLSVSVLLSGLLVLSISLWAGRSLAEGF